MYLQERHRKSAVASVPSRDPPQDLGPGLTGSSPTPLQADRRSDEKLRTHRGGSRDGRLRPRGRGGFWNLGNPVISPRGILCLAMRATRNPEERIIGSYSRVPATSLPSDDTRKQFREVARGTKTADVRVGNWMGATSLLTLDENVGGRLQDKRLDFPGCGGSGSTTSQFDSCWNIWVDKKR